MGGRGRQTRLARTCVRIDAGIGARVRGAGVVAMTAAWTDSVAASVVDVSVIVTTRGRASGCRRLIQAVTGQFARNREVSYELVLVFDGCAMYGWVDDGDRRVQVLRLPERVGIAQARNAGIEGASGLLLAFLDDDCVPAPTWLADLLRMSRQYPDHVAFG